MFRTPFRYDYYVLRRQGVIIENRIIVLVYPKCYRVPFRFYLEAWFVVFPYDYYLF